MSDPVTSNIQLAVPTRGSDAGTWDAPLNGDMTIIDSCLGGVTTVATSGGSVINLSVSQARANLIRITGTLTGNAQITTPGIVKSWYVQNSCVVGAFFVIFSNASGGQVVGLPPGEIVQIVSDGTNMYFINLGRVGEYIDYAVAAVPAWISNSTVPPYLNCDGSTFSAGTYPQLATILGGTTLPDARARSRIAMDGGTGRVTTAGSGIDGATRFSVGGAQNITLDVSMMPAHSHSGTTGGQSNSHTHPYGFIAAATVAATGGPVTGGNQSGNNTGDNSQDHTHNFTTGNTGGGAFHFNMQPTYVGGITMIRAA